MPRPPRKLIYALEAVVDIAYNARPEPVQAKRITERQGVPQRYLEQVMQCLVRAGILKGVRGPRGGYTLARERRRISVGEVVRVIEAMDAEGDEEKLDAGSELGRRVVRPLWQELNDATLTRLDATTLEDLCVKARDLGVRPESRDAGDFAI
jgi:Rrf2 family transcriptional regulator, iron-sulfur cluster assembly transcription factor